jgi:hypothetical protein
MEEEKQQAEETQEPVVPQREDIPEKFWGKPISEVIESYKNAEKLITQKSQEFNQLMEKLDSLSSKLNTDEVEEEEKDEGNDLDFEFVTKKDLQEILKNSKQVNPEEIETKVASTILAEIEKRDFIRNHQDLFDGKTQEQTQQLISKIASVGINAGAKNLEEAFNEFAKLAEETLGVSYKEQQNMRPVPSSDLGGGREVEENPDNLLEHMISFHKKHGSGLSGMIKY